jgi:hypothetical protein
MWGNIEQYSSTSAWDGALVEISLNGGGFTQLTPIGGYTHTSNGYNSWPSGTPCWSGAFGWTEIICDLSAYADNNVQIRFRFSSDIYLAYEGWYIDDVEITSLDCTPALGWLEGTVTDINGPIEGGQVFADDGTGNTGSDTTISDGSYSMSLAAGTYTVDFSHVDHRDTTVTGVSVTEGDTTVLDVQMELEQQPTIPTLSEWGMIILSLLLLAAGTVAMIRRSKPVPAVEKRKTG